MKLSIIIPAFNEEKTILSVLKKLQTVSLPQISREYIVVDDGSIDKTPEVVEKFAPANKEVKFFRHAKNRGKGAAVRTGIEHATGEYVLIQDADLEYDPSDIISLLEPILQKKTEVVYGTRLKRMPNFSRDERTPQFFAHYLGNKVLSLITSILYGQWITDMETGYKLFPRDALRNITLHARSFELEPEITAKLLKNGYKIYEVPIKSNPRDYGQGKKLIAWKDGPIALWNLIKYRFIN